MPGQDGAKKFTGAGGKSRVAPLPSLMFLSEKPHVDSIRSRPRACLPKSPAAGTFADDCPAGCYCLPRPAEGANFSNPSSNPLATASARWAQ